MVGQVIEGFVGHCMVEGKREKQRHQLGGLGQDANGER